MNNNVKCRLCLGFDLEQVIDLGYIPISHNLRHSLEQEEKKYPISFHYCKNCGLLQICNSINPDELYNLETSTTGHQIPSHIDEMIKNVLSYKEIGAVLDVGCNDGSFLNSIASFGFTKIIGIEPNANAAKIAEKKTSHKIYTDYFSPDMAEKLKNTEGVFDFIFARHVLEHVTDIHSFLNAINIALSQEGLVIIELPRVEIGFDAKTPVILWEEHVSYFTESIMSPMFNHFGLEIIDKKYYEYGGGSVAYIARRTQPKELSLKAATDFPITYFREYDIAISGLKEQIQEFIAQALQKNYKILLYGAGPRSCVLLNYAGVIDKVDVVIDDRKDIKGYYMPGTDKKISILDEVSFDNQKVIALLGVGAEYEQKILNKLQDKLGYTPISVSMFPPLDIRESITSVPTFN
ncbi:MAG: class I SAM-dependent methyltransferase [Pseudomonadota bacterium]